MLLGCLVAVAVATPAQATLLDYIPGASALVDAVRAAVFAVFDRVLGSVTALVVDPLLDLIGQFLAATGINDLVAAVAPVISTGNQWLPLAESFTAFLAYWSAISLLGTIRWALRITPFVG